MVQGELYHLLRNDPHMQRVVLVAFTASQQAKLLVIKSEAWEAALDSNVSRTTDAETLPPWLSTHVSLSALAKVMFDSEIKAGQKAADTTSDEEEKATDGASVAEERRNHIRAAVENSQSILSAPDPNLALNRYARACQPAQNETRFRCWFYAFLAFGYNVAALYPAFHNRGRYDRGNPKYTKPFGAPGAAGAHARAKMTTPEMAKKILEAFDKVDKRKKTRVKIYNTALRESFGCRVQDINGNAAYFHPNGEPFPTYNQFWYRCEKDRGGSIGIKKLIRGEETVRNEDTPSKGNYSMG